ncbi:hypothetical protein, partial [Ilumatobacter nonamiensis]|uniref:hypothetical protein n=1 Tax=Ilumatobacter nonamiensis TaxID=467093 RepID=UPI0019D3E359
MGVRTSVAAVQTAIASIADDAWQPIEYTCDAKPKSPSARCQMPRFERAKALLNVRLDRPDTPRAIGTSPSGHPPEN